MSGFTLMRKTHLSHREKGINFIFYLKTGSERPREPLPLSGLYSCFPRMFLLVLPERDGSRPFTLKKMTPETALRKLRKFCLALPEVKETMTFGNPTFMAGKRTFVVLDKYKGDYAIAFKATPADQMVLIMDPRFYITPYSGKHGWTSLKLSDDMNWEEIRDLTIMSYRLVALKRMIRLLDQKPRNS